MSMKAGAVGASATIEGPVQPSEDIVPCFAVVPMGWNQALWLCQGLHEAIVSRVPELTEANRFVDGKPGIFVREGTLAHTEYVDNFVALSMDRDQVKGAAEMVSDEMQRARLPVHETDISIGGQTLGWEIAPDEHEVGATPRSIWRIRLGLTQAGGRLAQRRALGDPAGALHREVAHPLGAVGRHGRELPIRTRNARTSSASLACCAPGAPVGQGLVHDGLSQPLGSLAPRGDRRRRLLVGRRRRERPLEPGAGARAWTLQRAMALLARR